jgi:carbonic anhydrase
MRLPLVVSVLLLAAAPAAAQVPTVCPMPAHPDSSQSPVNIAHATASVMQPLGTKYPVVPGTAINDGHRVQVNVRPGDSITVDGRKFGLMEFHFHWPGEHTLAGTAYPVEIHMVHHAANGKVTVLGTWVQQGARNAAWDALWAHLPTGPKDSVQMSVDIPRLFSLGSLQSERVYRYCGSLTTAPYTAGITWLMRRTPIQMSAAQIEKLRRVMGRYSRPLQPLNGRIIRYRRPGT